MKECTIYCRISAKIKTNKTISEKDSRKTRLKHCLPSNILVLFHKILFKKKIILLIEYLDMKRALKFNISIISRC